MLAWRALVAAAVLSLALGAALYEGSSGGRSAVAPTAVRVGRGVSREGLLGLPVAARGPISAALGADSAAYRVSAAEGGFRASSPAQRLRSSFSSSGVSVASGATRLGLSLRGVGYGSALKVLGSTAPRAEGNRVIYAHPGLSEWYANGPLGLEQGFTLTKAPAGRAVGALTLSIALSGDADASLTEGAKGIILTRAGKTVLRYTGLSATDALGQPLHSWLVLEGGRLLLRVDARGARYPLRIDPFVQQGEKLTGSEEIGEAHFGWSVALSSDGDTALIGGPWDHSDVGAAWVFTRSGSTWTQQGGKLTGSGEKGEGVFGLSVALSAEGNTALIGAGGDNGSIGAAWVFTRSGEKWTQQGAKLTDKEEIEGGFGDSVALSSDGDTALIGGSIDDDGVGAAWVFTRSGSTWTQQSEKLTGAGEVGKGAFGFSVALSADGDTALIGGWDDNSEVGAAWVFTRSGSKWSQQGSKLTGGGEVGNAVFGWSVSLASEGNIALIGGNGDNSDAGAAWAFTRSGSTWTQQGSKLTSGESDYGFGDSVALSSDGEVALIGGEYDNGDVGAAWVLTRSGSTWTRQGATLTGGGESGLGYFGRSVALSSEGSTALIGGYQDNSQAGAAWVFENARPTVETGSGSEVTPSSATLNGTVNPIGEEVSGCSFEYGTTNSYGESIACSPSPGSAETPVAVSASLTGLAADTTYHFRIVASNAGGTSYGSDQTFTTLVSSMSATTENAEKPAEAKDGPLSATASDGTGTVTVGQYGSDPGGTRLFASGGEYIDVYHSAGSSFTEIAFEDCELNGATTLYWWDPQANSGNGAWEQVTRQTYIAGPPACIKVEIEPSGTSPTVAQMTGTRFGDASTVAAPEFGRCATGPSKQEGKKTLSEGYFTGNTCQVLSEAPGTGKPTGKYEWELKVFEKRGDRSALAFTTKLAAGSVTLESAVKSSKVTCTGETSGGEYTGTNALGGVIVTLTGCTQGAEKCTSAGRSPGEIVTSLLEGVLGWEAKVKNKVALDLLPVGYEPGQAGPFMKFSCGSTSVLVQGSVIVPIKANKMSSTATLKFKASKGKQKPESFETGPKDVLEESVNGGALERTGLSATITQTNGAQVEVNSTT